MHSINPLECSTSWYARVFRWRTSASCMAFFWFISVCRTIPPRSMRAVLGPNGMLVSSSTVQPGADHFDHAPHSLITHAATRKLNGVRPPLCISFRLNWAKQAQGTTRWINDKNAPGWVRTRNPLIITSASYPWTTVFVCCNKKIYPQ